MRECQLQTKYHAFVFQISLLKELQKYFELKLHIHTLGTSEAYFTSCKKEHNRSPLIHLYLIAMFILLNNSDSFIICIILHKLWLSALMDNCCFLLCKFSLRSK